MVYNIITSFVVGLFLTIFMKIFQNNLIEFVHAIFNLVQSLTEKMIKKSKIYSQYLINTYKSKMFVTVLGGLRKYFVVVSVFVLTPFV